MAILHDLAVIKPSDLFQDHLSVLQVSQDMASAGGSDIYGKIILLHALSPLLLSSGPLIRFIIQELLQLILK